MTSSAEPSGQFLNLPNISRDYPVAQCFAGLLRDRVHRGSVGFHGVRVDIVRKYGGEPGGDEAEVETARSRIKADETLH